MCRHWLQPEFAPTQDLISDQGDFVFPTIKHEEVSSPRGFRARLSQIDEPRRSTLRWAVLIAAVVAISVGHYLTPPSYFHWHVLYQRMYYLPILFGAFWYGLSGGFALAVITSVLYVPHIVLHWGHAPLYRTNQFAEILMFFVIGTIAGFLSDRIRREREQHRRTAEELAQAYRQLQATFERLRLVDRLSALGAL